MQENRVDAHAFRRPLIDWRIWARDLLQLSVSIPMVGPNVRRPTESRSPR